MWQGSHPQLGKGLEECPGKEYLLKKECLLKQGGAGISSTMAIRKEKAGASSIMAIRKEEAGASSTMAIRKDR